MAESPDWSDWRHLLETGKQFSAMTRSEAQQRAQDLVREGKLAQDKVQSFVDGLVRTSRQRADELVEIVRTEVQRQLEARGITARRAAAKAKKAKRSKQSAKAKKKAKKKAPAKKTAKKSAPKKPAKKAGAGAAKRSRKAGTKPASGKKAGARKPSGST